MLHGLCRGCASHDASTRGREEGRDHSAQELVRQRIDSNIRQKVDHLLRFTRKEKKRDEGEEDAFGSYGRGRILFVMFDCTDGNPGLCGGAD
jgi:hypothetical protein